MGIIDSLSAGFNRVARHLWLILVPVLVDLAIGAGPRLSVQRLSQAAASALPNAAEFGNQYGPSIELARQWLTDLGTGANMLTMLSMRALGLPSLSETFGPGSSPLPSMTGVIEIETWPKLAGLTVLLLSFSLLVGCFCLSCMAQEAIEEDPNVGYALKVTARSWIRLVVLILSVGVVSALVILGMSVAYGLLAILGPQIAALLLAVFGIGSLWSAAYLGVILFFTVRALVLDDIGIRHSLWSSVNIVRRSLLSAVGFILLVNVIQAGLLRIWRVLAINPAGTLVGIVGNAYVSSGLVTASFIFYRDKYVAWQEARRQAFIDKGLS